MSYRPVGIELLGQLKNSQIFCGEVRRMRRLFLQIPLIQAMQGGGELPDREKSVFLPWGLLLSATGAGRVEKRFCKQITFPAETKK